MSYETASGLPALIFFFHLHDLLHEEQSRKLEYRLIDNVLHRKIVCEDFEIMGCHLRLASGHLNIWQELRHGGRGDQGRC